MKRQRKRRRRPNGPWPPPELTLPYDPEADQAGGVNKEKQPMTNLEQHAIAAFHASERWHVFVQRHEAAVLKAERAQPGTVDRLLHLLTTGERSGMEPPPLQNCGEPSEPGWAGESGESCREAPLTPPGRRFSDEH